MTGPVHNPNPIQTYTNCQLPIPVIVCGGWHQWFPWIDTDPWVPVAVADVFLGRAKIVLTGRRFFVYWSLHKMHLFVHSLVVLSKCWSLQDIARHDKAWQNIGPCWTRNNKETTFMSHGNSQKKWQRSNCASIVTRNDTFVWGRGYLYRNIAMQVQYIARKITQWLAYKPFVIKDDSIEWNTTKNDHS